MNRWLCAICVALLLTVCVGCYVYMKLKADEARDDFVHLLPTLSYLVNDYTRTFVETEVWPSPGTIYDDSMMPLLRSTTEDGVRIDTYGTFSGNDEVEIRLRDDGTILALIK